MFTQQGWADEFIKLAVIFEMVNSRTAGEYGTGAPASIVAQMIGRGEIEERNVLPPEKCVDPEKFFSKLGRKDIKVI